MTATRTIDRKDLSSQLEWTLVGCGLWARVGSAVLRESRRNGSVPAVSAAGEARAATR